MSAPPPEQPVYYSPGPAASSPAPVAGAPIYQYQQPDQIQHQQVTTLQQPYYPQPSPQPVQQQAYYAQSPQPQPQVLQQPQVFEQPTAVYTTQNVATEPPVVIKGSGRGLTGKLPQVENCCLCFPLHTGGMIIAAVMFIFYGVCGLILLTAGAYAGGYAAVAIVIGILYLLVALISAYGFMGIYKEEAFWVDRFIKFFLIGSLIWLILEIGQLILGIISVNNACSAARYYGYSCSFNWAGWIIPFIIGVFFQYYFCCCLVSYQRVLHARLNDLNGGTFTTAGGKDIQMH
ncbi:hypothetical protein BGX28_008143 [Mortierella sp. GBA30]|nr:hypothetical protein BGX28_008143 [Mortierella sp. GBA30]